MKSKIKKKSVKVKSSSVPVKAKKSLTDKKVKISSKASRGSAVATAMKSPPKPEKGKKSKTGERSKVQVNKSEAKPAPSISTTLVGKTISSFSVFNSKGEPVSPDSFKGHKVVLYFYPKDDTPGCTLEGQQFSKLAKEFAKVNTLVYGVSKDSVNSHHKFICKYDFKIDLISDENEQLCQIFDVIKEKNMYGRKYMGIERSTFVLDENVKVIKEMRKVSPDGHAEMVLNLVKAL